MDLNLTSTPTWSPTPCYSPILLIRLLRHVLGLKEINIYLMAQRRTIQPDLHTEMDAERRRSFSVAETLPSDRRILGKTANETELRLETDVTDVTKHICCRSYEKNLRNLQVLLTVNTRVGIITTEQRAIPRYLVLNLLRHFSGNIQLELFWRYSSLQSNKCVMRCFCFEPHFCCCLQ
jgi:hypothetical protein